MVFALEACFVNLGLLFMKTMYVCMHFVLLLVDDANVSLSPFEISIPYSGFCGLVIDHRRLRNQIWRENNQ